MNKKLKDKLIVSALFSFAIACSIFTNVFAGNTSDTYWSFSTFGDKGTKYTDPRLKTDTTPAYVNVVTYTGKSDDYLQMYLVDSNYQDFHQRLVKTVSGPGQYSVHSYAYEDRGQVYVRMAFYAPYRWFYSWSASGYWSPDSTRTYK